MRQNPISAIEYGNLKKSSKVTESDHNAIERFECREQLALGEEVSEKDIQLWDGGTLGPVLKRFEIVNESLGNTQSLDEFENATRIAPKDRTYATSQMIIFYSVMSLLQGKGIQPPYSLKKGTDKLFIQHNLFICPLPPQTRGITTQRSQHMRSQQHNPRLA
ncbi:hypothetical protein BJAS_P3793 [Bathymodiolus japonicus methanotrophic gill symbiont]|uniref:hypothetical protein n=1 Tax=Bathymodiolus japonicus methanotrophic gill symbiont TaxID=113269 RepID=UPI001B7C9B4D|nr:hypothetical protein [Bathymodiolus japonicus methanotrophic gill symbiont]GFO73159.1 hypothetical protein BJAS_P3793 [Bathymodiolus japonicus methanotrophic gill symbiont]